MNDFECPFCRKFVSATVDTVRECVIYFNKFAVRNINSLYANTDIFDIVLQRCSSCGKVSMYAEGRENLEGIIVPLNPKSLAQQFPEYVPSSIREDYEEAYAILNLSPKASATLSRRCLQGMIRNFWGITRNDLYQEITAIQNKVTPSQWKAIDSVCSIGNIGAHMRKDVNEIIGIDDNEAEQLLKLIELLVDKWYIARNDEEELLKSIVEIKDNKTKTDTKKKEELQEV